MKKVISIILLIASLITILCSCNQKSDDMNSAFDDMNLGSDDISYVQIDTSLLYTCQTIYLYAFKNAKIDPNYESTSSTETPSSTGYIYSYDKLEVGDSIKVWQDFMFGKKTSSYQDDRQRGTEAIVDEIVAVYRVKVKRNTDTYIITYYTVPDTSISYTTVTKRESVKELEKHKIEITKDRVIINYDV